MFDVLDILKDVVRIITFQCPWGAPATAFRRAAIGRQACAVDRQPHSVRMKAGPHHWTTRCIERLELTSMDE
jgi:hypothetical protein